LRRQGSREKCLVLDRGFFSSETLDFLSDKKVSFVIPAKRNSQLYDEVTEMNDVFGYRGRMISAGKKAIENFYAYVYLDGFPKAEEESPCTKGYRRS
jgi:transposase